MAATPPATSNADQPAPNSLSSPNSVPIPATNRTTRTGKARVHTLVVAL